MVSRRTILGLLVLGLVAAGVYWARVRPSAPSDDHPPMATARQAPSAAGSAEEALPDVTVADASVDAGGVRITLSLPSRPPVAYAKTRVLVSASAKATADTRLAIEGGLISFEMTMPMGDHRYSLVPADRAGYEAEAVLPLCMSGNRRWYAIVEGTVAGRPVTARFRIDLTPPGERRDPDH